MEFYFANRYFGLCGISYLSCQFAHHKLNQTALNAKQEEVEREMGHGQVDQRGVSDVFVLIG